MSEISYTALYDSLLEKKLVDALQSFVEHKEGILEKTLIRGATGFRFMLPSNRVWELELQPYLGKVHGVMVDSRPLPDASSAVRGGLRQLRAFLENPNATGWQWLASFTAFWLLQQTVTKRSVAGAELEEALGRWRRGDVYAVSGLVPTDDGDQVYGLPTRGDTYLLVYIDSHDKAYRWARNKRFEVHEHTGCFQVFDLEEVRSVEARPEWQVEATETAYPLSFFTDDELFQAGVRPCGGSVSHEGSAAGGRDVYEPRRRVRQDLCLDPRADV